MNDPSLVEFFGQMARKFLGQVGLIRNAPLPPPQLPPPQQWVREVRMHNNSQPLSEQGPQEFSPLPQDSSDPPPQELPNPVMPATTSTAAVTTTATTTTAVASAAATATATAEQLPASSAMATDTESYSVLSPNFTSFDGLTRP